MSRANCPEVLLHLSSITNEDHLSLRKDNFLVCYCRDFESHNKFVKTLTSVKLCNSCYFNGEMHEQLLRFLINSHFLDGFNWTWNVLSTCTTWLLECNYHEIQITFQLLLFGVVAKGWVPLLWNNAFYSEKTYHNSSSHKFIMIDSSAGNKTLENASSFTRSLPSKSEGIALCSALILSSVLITAGNLLALVLFASTKPLRRKSLFLVMNMTFAEWMLGAFTLPFYIFFVFILNILIHITKTSIPSKFYHMVNVLNYSNSFVNPIVYVFRITEFQQALRSCCTKRRPAIKMVKTERRNRKVALRTPDIELRILRNDPSRLQVEVEREYMETKL